MSTKVIDEHGEYWIDKYGNKRWYKNGKRHREDGPAVEYASGNKFYYQYDKIHRIDGPAVEWADGSGEYWINDIKYNSLEEALMDQAIR